MTVVALDPGPLTGVAFANGGARGYAQLKQEDLWDALTTLDPVTLVVESFQFRQAMSKVNLIPVEIIGMVKEWARQHDVPIVWQTPSQAKHFFDNDRLRERNAWAQGMPHARDATRHLLYFLEFGGGKNETRRNA